VKKINKNIIALGINSFFTDFSTEMVLPLLPIFLEHFLHATKGEIGLIEGSAEMGVALLIALSGFYSDRAGKRKGLTYTATKKLDSSLRGDLPKWYN